MTIDRGQDRRQQAIQIVGLHAEGREQLFFGGALLDGADHFGGSPADSKDAQRFGMKENRLPVALELNQLDIPECFKDNHLGLSYRSDVLVKRRRRLLRTAAAFR